MLSDQRHLPYLANFLTSCIFGFSFIFTKEALNVLMPFQLLGFRFAVAALFLSLLILFNVTKINLKGKSIKKLLLLAIFQPILYFIFETLGIKLTSASETGIIIAVIPIITAAVSALILKENPSKVQMFFITLSVSGVLFIVLMQGSLKASNHLTGVFYLLLAVLSAAIYSVLSRMNSGEFNPQEITFIMMWAGAIIFNSIGLSQAVYQGVNMKEYFLALTDYRAYSAVLYLGIFSSVLAFFLLNYCLAHITASQSAVFHNLATIISVLAGVLILKENFYWYQALGGLLIIAGVWGTNYFKTPIQTEHVNQCPHEI